MSLVLQAKGVVVEHHTPAGRVRAVDGVSLEVAAGDVVALVGESGSGKSSLARALVGLVPIAAGEVSLLGAPLPRGSWPRAMRRQVQLVFQDAAAALDPRLEVRASIAEGLEIHALAKGPALRQRVDALLQRVGLDPSLGARRPQELSAGQRQRVGLARALAVEPTLLILDEPVSQLDVSVQAQMVALLQQVRDPRRDGWLVITHDLSLVAQLAQRVLVLYAGQVVETGTAAQVLEAPRHPYTRALLASVPPRHPRERHPEPPIAGEPPSPFVRPEGCAFAPRCPHVMDRCRAEAPALVDGSACFLGRP